MFSPRFLCLALCVLTACSPVGAVEEKPGTAAGTEAPQHAERKPNRLVHEKSPYLLQHAYNPVQWYPWGAAAFKAARESGRPIFLSIGYSTCHWCHVMERESFENEEIAARLNRDFIAIKVDREERPDVDEVYMAAVMATTGRGGWPLSAFLTADGKPFFLGTYFPPQRFMGMLEQLATAWAGRQEKVLEHAESIAAHLKRDVGPIPSDSRWTRSDVDRGFEQLTDSYDPVHAGFGSSPRYAPKFPRTSNVDFLLAYHRLAGSDDALRMATVTLEKMGDGGIYDHVGKGFHRYSTDRVWLVPHFEKMLYDNCLVSRTYLNAYRLSGSQRFLQVARESLGYLLTRMSDPGGGFYSAEDADSEGEEGKYYVFDRKEVVAILGEEQGALFAERHGITEKGNFEHGKTVIHIAATIDELARKREMTAGDVRFALEHARVKLLAVRDGRVPPLRDDKILTDWNGMAISALSLAYQATGQKRYLDAARRTAEFISSHLFRDGKLLHRYRSGEARFLAYFEDYAFLVAGYLDLYEASLDLAYLNTAEGLAREMIRQFWDEKKAAFFHTGPQHEKLLIRTKEFYDGAIPSGNSVAAMDLHRLVAYTGDSELTEKAEQLARVAASLFQRRPQSHPKMLEAATVDLQPRIDVVIVLAGGLTAARAFAREIHRRYVPHRTVVRISVANRAAVAAAIPWLPRVEIPALLGGGDTAYALARVDGGDFQRLDTPAALGTFIDAVR